MSDDRDFYAGKGRPVRTCLQHRFVIQVFWIGAGGGGGAVMLKRYSNAGVNS